MIVDEFMVNFERKSCKSSIHFISNIINIILFGLKTQTEVVNGILFTD